MRPVAWTRWALLPRSRAKSEQVCSTTRLPQDKKRSPGNDLLSRTATSAVPSALEGLTTRFGMELGVSPPPTSPEEPILGIRCLKVPAVRRLVP